MLGLGHPAGRRGRRPGPPGTGLRVSSGYRSDARGSEGRGGLAVPVSGRERGVPAVGASARLVPVLVRVERCTSPGFGHRQTAEDLLQPDSSTNSGCLIDPATVEVVVGSWTQPSSSFVTPGPSSTVARWYSSNAASYSRSSAYNGVDPRFGIHPAAASHAPADSLRGRSAVGLGAGPAALGRPLDEWRSDLGERAQIATRSSQDSRPESSGDEGS